ncbi:MAG: hypothetical protein ABSG43_10565, partial [Solirubrobacteraceae bacterium]
LAQGTGTATTTTSEPASRPEAEAKPKRVTVRRASSTPAALPPEQKTADAKPRSRPPAAASTARANAGAPEARTGGRRDQLLALIVAQPGITIAQAAKQFGLKEASGLYAIARGLQADGLVRKSGAELHPTAVTQQN